MSYINIYFFNFHCINLILEKNHRCRLLDWLQAVVYLPCDIHERQALASTLLQLANHYAGDNF